MCAQSKEGCLLKLEVWAVKSVSSGLYAYVLAHVAGSSPAGILLESALMSHHLVFKSIDSSQTLSSSKP